MENANIYIATESLTALIVLILLYANIFEVKHNTIKRSLFTKLLIANEIVIVADLLTWMPLNYSKFPLLAIALVTITFTLPSIMKIYFSSYVYEHISSKAKTAKMPFTLLKYYSFVESLITFILCISGNLFYMEDGVYYEGSWMFLYYIMNTISVVLFILVIVLNGKKTSIHDMAAVLPYCIIPAVSSIISLITELNLVVTLISISLLIMYIMLQSEHESFLYGRAITDELTGLYNRASYEDEINKLEKKSNDTLVCASIDLNGLKAINDTLGHTAGDELIRGAAQCLKFTLGKYGKIFRTGGDEFAALIYVRDNPIESLIDELNAETEQWKGTNIKSLTLSIGCASKKEFPNSTMIELTAVADKRMYEEKAHFYANMGIDRSSQLEAHKALCALYNND